ncbi:MAG: polyprenyl synthetase family protein [Bacteroidales bacterium]|nr:polyprenyl synthetase family protein [Bacteroidales bacterium]
MDSIKKYQELINKNLNEELIGNSPENLYAPIKYVLKIGGKRLRSALCLMACEMFSGDYQQAIKPALALEIFHNFTLLHDDIMDDAPVRRNKTTVHKKWDSNIALLSGDAMSIIAYKYIAQTPVQLNQCLEVFNDTALKICEGQQLDMDFENNINVTIKDYIYMISLKTAVFIACSLKIGAIIGGANAKDSQLIYDAGYNIGLAFQLQDDLLDTYGEKNKFGKQIGGDIISNKKTFLLINALQSANKQQHEELISRLSIKNPDPNEKIKTFIDIYNNLNVKDETLNQINNYLELAITDINDISINSNSKESLYQFVDYIRNRNH